MTYRHFDRILAVQSANRTVLLSNDQLFDLCKRFFEAGKIAATMDGAEIVVGMTEGYDRASLVPSHVTLLGLRFRSDEDAFEFKLKRP